jgi:hypothetical protein
VQIATPTKTPCGLGKSFVYCNKAHWAYHLARCSNDFLTFTLGKVLKVSWFINYNINLIEIVHVSKPTCNHLHAHIFLQCEFSRSSWNFIVFSIGDQSSHLPTCFLQSPICSIGMNNLTNLFLQVISNWHVYDNVKHLILEVVVN